MPFRFFFVFVLSGVDHKFFCSISLTTTQLILIRHFSVQTTATTTTITTTNQQIPQQQIHRNDKQKKKKNQEKNKKMKSKNKTIFIEYR